MIHPASRYHRRLARDLLRAIVLPSAALFVFIRISRVTLGAATFPAYIVCIIASWVARLQYANYYHACRMRELDARPIPSVVGRWPGNIDIMLDMMRTFKSTYLYNATHLKLFEQYRCTTLNLRILWMDTIISMDSKHSQYLLTNGFYNFWRGNRQKERMETFLGNGIFNRDDGEWKAHRALARPFFARDRVNDFALFERYATRALDLIDAATRTGTACDVQDVYSRFTIDSASEFLFGKNLDTLSAQLPVAGAARMGPKGSATDGSWGEFVMAFEGAQTVASTRARIGHLWPLLELFTDKNVENARVIREWLDPLVKQAIDSRGTFVDGEKNFMQHLADSTDDPVIISDQLLSMLLAARDTTSCLITYATYFMALHPDVATELRHEVFEVCGASGTPSSAQLKAMPYLRAVLNETLRLFPPVPLNIRESRPSGCTLPPPDATYPDLDTRRLYMPGSTTITYFPILIQRNTAMWGDDADAFHPARWMESDAAQRLAQNPLIFAPFSAGPRIVSCQDYAYNQASYFLVRLLQRFNAITLAPECQPKGSLPPPEWKHLRGRQSYEAIWPAAALTLFIKGGLWVRFSNSAVS
ncbi:cytochrome P450 monooxygenase CYP63 [Fistulina hepatica ATCC 64428]|uniref:Cytochrome P450 monooxygenase CYP63 n=1 Tax=Fistulina hepatica ATCC 64428 TaxID=1128425 RepID=A0A0D7AK61_9AGAR|nr:cytochrome P450 monooxygenase CYP63 [Fistulina hepatica ATCC 64428]